MKKEEFYFDSKDGASKIHAVRWLPDSEKPECIVQLLHGMEEYIERYDGFAKFLVQNNILVVGHDHLGHGGSIGEHGMKGYFCKENGTEVLVEDAHTLRTMMQEQYPVLPYVIIGHSMGSFVLRNYLFRYGEGLWGTVIVGTGCQPALLLKVGKVVSAVQKVLLGDKHIAAFIDHATFGNYNKRIQNPLTEKDWLTKDESIVKAYVADEFCGFGFTVNGFRTLFELIDEAGKIKNMRKMNRELPVLFAAGEEDPVGNYGKDIHKVCKMFEKAGMKKVEYKLYPDDRHEILNETDKEKVYADILDFVGRIKGNRE